MPAIRRGQRFFALPFLLVITLAASLVLAGPAEARPMRDRKIAHAVKIAINQKGDPYVYGAAGPNAFDCSGLLMYAYAKAGIRLARSAEGQYRQVRHINKRNVRRGDFVFFHDGSGHVYHAAIFLGRDNGRRFILSAPHSGTVVRRDPIWTGSWYAGTLRHR